ncbi:MAG: IclR family transcriptional regulator C-terminal domain-containing protein [Clostridiales bacterium]
MEAETGENINLAIANCDQVLLVHRVECNHVLRPNFPLNTPFPAYKTGLGMVFLAEKSKASLEWIYENNQPNIGISLDEFIMRAKKDREAGYAFDDQLFCPGLRCIAAPISGPGGLVMFSLSVSGPATRMDDETCQKIQKLAVKYAHIMSNEILALG